MKKVILFVSCMLFSGVLFAAAGGGQVKAENPIIDEDGNPIGQVFTFDSEACKVASVDQSGKVVYVICIEE